MALCGTITVESRAQKADVAFLNDAQVGMAIRRGLEYLYRCGKPDGTWQTKYSQQYVGGVEALVVLTALSAGERPSCPAIEAALIYLNRIEPPTVYARSLRMMVYARLSGTKNARRLAADVAWLLKHQNRSGGWGYGPEHPTTRLRANWTDMSNSQLAVLALSEAACAGAHVPTAIWRTCRNYWHRAHNKDGGWGYEPFGGSAALRRGNSYGSMTAASVATLFILTGRHAAQEEPAYNIVQKRRSNPPPDLDAMQRGLKWLRGNHAVDHIPKWIWGQGSDWLYYYLYCLLRVTDAGGLRTVDGNDLQTQIAAFLLARQRDNGSWADPEDPGADADEDDWKDAPVRTCFALLCLIKARKPALVNKLSLEGPWSYDSCDAANLAGWFSQTFKRPVTWQRVSETADEQVLLEAPILYISGSDGFVVPKKLDAAISSFVRGGGTVLVQGFTGQASFAGEAERYFQRLFPDYHSEPLRADHPVFHVSFQIPASRCPAGVAIGDYCRMRIFILRSDLSGAWHQNRREEGRHAFEFFANLLLYTTDMAYPVGRWRGRSRSEAAKPSQSITLARVKHNGDWNTCPLAMMRLGEATRNALGIGLHEAEAVDLTTDVPADIPLLWLTGSLPPRLSADQRSHLKKYVLAGGTLFIDAAVGNKAFVQATRQMVREMFGEANVKPLTAQNTLLSGNFAGGVGCRLSRISYTAAVRREHPNLNTPVLLGVELDGRIAVVLSPYGVTCPLEGNPTYGSLGLSTDDARRLAVNVAIYASVKRTHPPTRKSR
ncbi:MAG: DUF4159 domain-containing protein [Planctomycetota bacterium]|nr:DUF4159 domain-containing protein [Planctomycetota bacterium]